MIPTQIEIPALESLNQDFLKEICTSPGPCVTILLPAFRPGASDLPAAERLKTILREAAHELESRRYLGSVDRFLEPLKKLARSPESLAGGAGAAIYLTPSGLRHVRLPVPAAERLVAASQPFITPLLTHLIPRVSYVLAFSKKLTRLGRWRDGECIEISLPAGVSRSFEESLLLVQPDHDLQNHSAATRFGTGTERDLVHERLRHYLQHLDREIAAILRDAPLVLVGVAEELAAYRSVAGHPKILNARPTNPDHLALSELKDLCEEALLAARRSDAEKVVAQILETSRRDRVAGGVRTVLEAAHEGRVHRMVMEAGAAYQGLLGPLFPLDDRRVEGKHDLINAAAVETIRAGGDVYVVDPGELGDRPVAALLRYSE